jgi:DNA-binding beta-propeller fold protein YncE
MIYGKGKYSYELVEGWAKLPEGESFNDICSIAIDRLDRVFILNRSEHPVKVFDSEGNFLSFWGENYFGRAHGACISSDDFIFCTDDKHHVVTKFDTKGNISMVLGTKDAPSDTGYRQTSDLFESIASIKRGGPPFNRPTGVDLSSSGEIYISDGYGNARVHKFSPDGNLLLSWGEPGPGSGQFRLPHSVRVDNKNQIWVTDRENSRIQIFNERGRFLNQLIDLIRPTDLCFHENLVYVSELCKRVSIFTENGVLLSRWGNETHSATNPLFVAPHSIAVDSRGNIYVGEVATTYVKVNRGSRTIQKFIRVR